MAPGLSPGLSLDGASVWTRGTGRWAWSGQETSATLAFTPYRQDQNDRVEFQDGKEMITLVGRGEGVLELMEMRVVIPATLVGADTP